MTAMVPPSITIPRNDSTNRIGLRALVTITRTNSSVVTSAIDSRMPTPALTNNRSNRLGCNRSRSAST
jgi:hypothetical protein